ncbi:disulfide bond formation protein B [Oscillochloris sp. ZM17-4]|uniref:disulfide bond formation protein B n=1 Tax=Oscillochloris sp. ZM17-4 TaxID=2866714 RepID=UPI001C72D108|nr:disulfide bond formation protein B [Oscillochloris sp. ZM17-4]MBX0328943.1 disulfide bond formation protein B [Oscillochloris sp. ZM17-4]
MAQAKEMPMAGDDAQAAMGGLVGLLTASCRHIALLAAMVATCGSLFFSDMLGWLPCQLCWYQRILMYPLTVILAVGILRRDRGLHWYALPLSLMGMGVSTFHYLEVMKIIEPSPCSGVVPCSIDYLTPILTGPLGFIKIPFLALVAFTIISIMLGNFVVAGDEALPADGRAQAAARWWALGIVAATVLAFLGLAALL